MKEKQVLGTNGVLKPTNKYKNGKAEKKIVSPDRLNNRSNSLWHYSPALESTKHVQYKSTYGHFLNGEFVKGRDYVKNLSPSTEEILYEVATGHEKEVDQAVSFARQAYKARWSTLSGSQKAKYLYRIGRLIQEKSRELAILETMDNGKPIQESRDVDIPLAASHFMYYAGWADKLNYATPYRNVSSLGVAGQIIPWNFPLLMAAWKIAPALASGNTVVLKPAETTPLTAMKLAEIFQEAGLPPGVVNIVNGSGQTGAALVAHPDVDKIAFTGSTAVGKHIQRVIAGHSKRLTLELGGKGANILFEDAAIDQAIEGIVQGIFFNQGQVCCAGSRLLVQESIVDEVLQKLKMRMASLQVGDPLDKNTDIGAIHTSEQLRKIRHYERQGVEEGADKYQSSCSLPKKGYFFPPTFFHNVSPSHTIAQEEIFGPLLSVMTFRTPEEAVKLANNTPYGLSAGVWTEKGSKLFQIAGMLRTGVVWGNTYNQFDPASPFGGYKESGFGREGGLHGLLPYLEVCE